jgi:predicted PurR-regulated permease PerM
MQDSFLNTARFRRTILVILAVAISALFLWMIREFLIALLLASIAAGLSYPFYKRLVMRFRGRKNLAASVTIGLLLLLVIVPLAAFGSLVLAQALEVSHRVRPWVQSHLSQATELDQLLERYPELASLKPYREQILSKLGEVGSVLGTLAVGLMTGAARELMSFFLLLFVMLYSTFFFLTSGSSTLRKMLFYFPLPAEDEEKMVQRFVSVARATLKGTFVVGIVQGALGGLGFWVAGVGGAALWAAMMALLSVIPGLGTAVVWIPACIYLMISGHVGAALGLAAYCALIVGTVDNFLRPWLVGKDTEMPDLLILLATLGGIVLFGVMGFVIGPIVAALFVTIWELYGEAFRDLLPDASPPSRTSIMLSAAENPNITPPG